MQSAAVEKHIAIFETQEIRKARHGGEWWFAIVDVVAALTNSANPSEYLKKLRKRDVPLSETFKGGGQIVPPLSLRFETAGGVQKLLAWNTAGIFRLVQSIPSARAEPFKRWLAQIGVERMREIEDPELASERLRAIYRAKGYSDQWIEKRMRSIAVREELAGEWKKRGIKVGVEYGILTSEISKAAFGLTPAEYRKLKGLKRERLRDHMSDLELIFSMLSEASTTEIARARDARGFPENRHAAVEGGTVAGTARRSLEKKSGRKIVSRDNYLQIPEARQRLRREN
jgi:hypothetical protein